MVLECIASIIKLNWDTTQTLWLIYQNKQKHQSSLQLFCGVHVARSLVFCIMFYSSLFVLLSFFFWPLYCLSFFDLHVLITPLVSSNFSFIKVVFDLLVYFSYCFGNVFEYIHCNNIKILTNSNQQT